MTAIEIVGLTHIALTSSISVIRILKEHHHCHHELSEIFAKVEEATDELRSNIYTLKETRGSSQEPSQFLKNILKRVQKVCAEISSIQKEFEATSTVAAFFKASRWTAKFKELLERIELYDLMLNNLGSTGSDVSKKNAQDSAHAFLDMLISRSLSVKVIQWLKSEIQGLAREETDANGIDIYEIGKIDPMRELLTSESRSTNSFLFGKLYYEGSTVKGKAVQDYFLSARYLAAALDQGVWEAAFYLGELHFNGLGVTKNLEEAFKLYQVGAKMNDGESLFKMGWCLYCGLGTERDETAGREYYKLSYEAGSGKGAEYYGFALFHGRDIPVDTKKGFKIMMQAKDKGIVDVKLDLAYCYENGIEVDGRSSTKAYLLTKEAYDAGGLWAADNLARYYLEGLGVQKDLKEAVRIYRKTWKEGGVEALDAQASLGMCYIMGRGVQKNFLRGLSHIRETCVEGSSRGWQYLGDCYRYGHGVVQNFDTSVLHYNRAIVESRGATNVVKSHLALGEMCEEGVGTRYMEHKAYYYYKFAAERYNTEAQWKMGLMFEEGREVDIHFDRAFYYFKLSARGGHEKAQERAGEYLIRGQAVERTRVSTIDTIEDAAGRGDRGARGVLQKLRRSRLFEISRRYSL